MILLPSDVRIPIFLYLFVTSLNENTKKNGIFHSTPHTITQTTRETRVPSYNSKNSFQSNQKYFFYYLVHSIQARTTAIMWHSSVYFPKTQDALVCTYPCINAHWTASHFSYTLDTTHTTRLQSSCNIALYMNWRDRNYITFLTTTVLSNSCRTSIKKMCI